MIIWDLNKEDDTTVATSGIGDDSHREPVCTVQWTPDPEAKGQKYNVRMFAEILLENASERVVLYCEGKSACVQENFV